MKFAPPRFPRVGSFVALGVSLAAGFAADAASAVARQFGVTDYGAVADGKTPNPVAIRTASVRAGNWGDPGGSIFLKRGVERWLAEGAVLRGSMNIADYPKREARIGGHFAPWRMARVNAQGLTRVRSGGEGSINGNGVPEWPAVRDRRTNNPKCPHREVERPRLRFIDRCRHGRVEGLALPDAGGGDLPVCLWRDARIAGRRITLTAGGAVRAAMLRTGRRPPTPREVRTGKWAWAERGRRRVSDRPRRWPD